MNEHGAPIAVLLVNKIERGEKVSCSRRRLVADRQVHCFQVMLAQDLCGERRFRKREDSADTLIDEPAKVFIEILFVAW
jgi:hypothetical protein